MVNSSAILAATKYFPVPRSASPVYSQFTMARWKRWHEFIVQFSIPFFFPFPLHSCRFFVATRLSPSIIYHFETSKTLLSTSVCSKNFARLQSSRLLSSARRISSLLLLGFLKRCMTSEQSILIVRNVLYRGG